MLSSAFVRSGYADSLPDSQGHALLRQIAVKACRGGPRLSAGQGRRLRRWAGAMSSISLYLATVRRARAGPLAERATARLASDRGALRSSPAIRRVSLSRRAAAEAVGPSPSLSPMRPENSRRSHHVPKGVSTLAPG